jgi:membrane associated rhomboid family serine protease
MPVTSFNLAVPPAGYIDAEEQPVDVIQEATYLLLALSLTVLAVVSYYVRPSVLHGTLRRANNRLVLGLPLGTFVIVAVNLVFFLVAQRAYTGDVLMVPYLSWSYIYPTGFLTGPIGHGGVSHITGNLIAATVFAPVVEYTIGHRNSPRPLTRALVGIPLAWYGIGVFISVFSWGPSIGFSGVVFFFFGFAVVFFPVVSVGLLAVVTALRTVVTALFDPITVQSAGETFSTPAWANIAVDAHALGFLLGVVAAVLLARRRDKALDGYRAGAAVLILGLAQGLSSVWAVDGSSYVLYRAVGATVVVFLSMLVAYAVTVETRAEPLLRLDYFDPRRVASTSALLVPVVLICVVGFVTGLGGVSTVDDVETVEVRDYTVWYGENVENERVVSIPLIDVAPVNFTVSGTFVTSESRGIWYQTASRAQLRSNPDTSFLVGGLTWDKEVEVERVGLTSSSGESAYSVLVTVENRTRPVYNSPAAETGTVVDGWRLNVSVVDGDRTVTMRRGDQRRRVYLDDTATTSEGVRFEVEDGNVVASHGDTRAVVGEVDGARQNTIR